MEKSSLKNNFNFFVFNNFILRFNKEILIHTQFCRFFKVKLDHNNIFCDMCGQVLLKFCPDCGSTSIFEERGFLICYNCKTIIEENINK